MEDVTKYDLTKKEFDECLNKAMMAILMGIKPSENPESVLIIAQPGAGKTGLRRFVEKEKSKEGKEDYIEIDPDVVGTFHKYQRKIIEEFPNESYMQLQKFISPAIDEYLRPKAIQMRSNLLQEGTLGNTKSWVEILKFQKYGGKAKLGEVQENGERREVDLRGDYDIQLNVLAVDRFESLLSSYEREQFLREKNSPPRAVTPENHDRAYESMLNTISILEQENIVNTVNVYKRGEIEDEPILVNTTQDRKYPNAVECIKQVREEGRKNLLKNSDEYLARIENLKSRVKSENLMQRIIDIEEEFLECLKEQEKNSEEKEGK